jgi:hypothetical protein
VTRTSRGDEHEMKSHVKSHAGKGRGKYNKLFIADRDACRCRRGCWEKNRRRAGRTGAELLNAVRVICLICNTARELERDARNKDLAQEK